MIENSYDEHGEIDCGDVITNSVTPGPLLVKEDRVGCVIRIPRGNKFLQIRANKFEWPRCLHKTTIPRCVKYIRKLCIGPVKFEVDEGRLSGNIMIVENINPIWNMQVEAQGLEINGEVSVCNSFGHLCDERVKSNIERVYMSEIEVITEDVLGGSLKISGELNA